MARVTPSHPTTHPRRGLAVAAALVAVSAWGGAVGLATGSLALEGGLNERLPLHSPVLGGLALAVVVAVPFTLLAASAWRGSERTDELALGSGALLVGWILVELAFVRALSFFHPLYLVIGGLFVFCGRHALNRDRGDRVEQAAPGA
jgi:hypothetical protein